MDSTTLKGTLPEEKPLTSPLVALPRADVRRWHHILLNPRRLHNLAPRRAPHDLRYLDYSTICPPCSRRAHTEYNTCMIITHHALKHGVTNKRVCWRYSNGPLAQPDFIVDGFVCSVVHDHGNCESRLGLGGSLARRPGIWVVGVHRDAHILVRVFECSMACQTPHYAGVRVRYSGAYLV